VTIATERRDESSQRTESYLADIRVIELADEQAEYCGRVLAGLGADVIKVEPPGGSPTRRIGPFYQDRPHPERSLFFWQYNLGKRSVALDLGAEADRSRFLDLLARADVLLESTPRGYLDRLGLGQDALLARFPSLVVARMSPFGDAGPWADYKGSDLVHLALGGPAMNTGYDPEPDGHYDLPPIAPQMWHAYHIAGEQLALGILGALAYRRGTGTGQYLSCAIHEAVAKNPEVDLQSWIMLRRPLHRQTCRHAGAGLSARTIGMNKDGRWTMAYLWGNKVWPLLLGFLDRLGMTGDLHDARYNVEGPAQALLSMPEVGQHVMEVIHRVFARYTQARLPWHEAQAAGLIWAPLRRPCENTLDPHWQRRGTFCEVDHPDLGRTFTYTASKWRSTTCDWRVGSHAPSLAAHTEEVFPAVAAEPPRIAVPASAPGPDGRRSRRGKPFALHGVRLLDLTWLLAAGGAPRFLSAMGAEDIKVEWKTSLDALRRTAPAPVGGREARLTATAPLTPRTGSINVSGQFNDLHPGQRSLSLNIRHPKGLDIVKRLVGISDIIAEGFTPGVLAGWGLGYDVLRAIKPDIIYCQQSGMGAQGTYGEFRSNGPISASLAGLSEMSGLPEPAPPAGWGYSYLDWFGAYSFALAMMAALHSRDRTGRGMWIDASQVEVGLYLTGTAILDWSANGRAFARYGNRSPYKPAAPHGIYRCRGNDRWLAIACFSEEEWQGLVAVAGHPEWGTDPRFVTLDARLAHQDALDAVITGWTVEQEAYALMHALQRAGVPAGVCQTAEDCYERDPQLQALEWLTEVTGTEIGTWPVKEFPVKMSATPAFMGGAIDRGAPCYGEDNEYVLGELLGFSSGRIQELADEGVI
jgi:crotonobetainyl-CoA:carnitine CoA-transferase CaiB-like acyl-CoA transferase